MRVQPITSHTYSNYSGKINNNNADRVLTKHNLAKEENINFQGKTAKFLTVLGGAFGACFGPLGLAAGAALGNAYGKIIDDGAEECDKSGLDTSTDDDYDPYHTYP